jgi:peptidoglycan-N-acetylglucosamine deacetylase
MLSLTFDAGPDPVWTPILLRRLARLDARASFFVVAPRARAHPGLVRAMRDDGHSVELHCWSHPRHGGSRRQMVEREVDRSLDALARIGVAPLRWRAPWGDRAEWSEGVAAARGLTLTGWSADTHDWRGDRAEQMLAAVRDDLGPGGVVRMHDGIGPGAGRGDCLQTVRLLAPLCRIARANGWALEPVPAPAAA